MSEANLDEINLEAANVSEIDQVQIDERDIDLGEAVVDAAALSASGVDEFLTGYIVRPGLCLNFEVTDRIRLGRAMEVCAGPLCPQRRLCLSRSLRRHLDEVAGNPWLRCVFDAALLEMGNSR